MEWKSIETAPRDGTPILVKGITENHVHVCWWKTKRFRDEFGDHDEVYPWAFVESDGFVNGAQDGPYGPTHWMPLPFPPTDTQQGEGE